MPIIEATLVTVVIANGQSLSAAGHIGAGTLIGIQLPTITTGTLSFQGSADGVTYVECVDASAAAVAYASSSGGVYIKAPADLAGVPYIKVRTGTSGSPVAQGAARTITLVVK